MTVDFSVFTLGASIGFVLGLVGWLLMWGIAKVFQMFKSIIK